MGNRKPGKRGYYYIPDQLLSSTPYQLLSSTECFFVIRFNFVHSVWMCTIVIYAFIRFLFVSILGDLNDSCMAFTIYQYTFLKT